MKILCIGNSFSGDATRYLRSIAKADGEKWNVVNLFIGGCPLYKHYINAMEDQRAYSIQIDGEGIGFFASIKEALINTDWDIVTIQQASTKSYDYDTYQPYLNYIVDYVRKYAPKVKIYVHQTWAYEEGSERLALLGFEHMSDMFAEIEKAYRAAAKDICADGLIPSGELLQNLVKSGVEKVHRDTFHAAFGVGRYAIALLWYALLGKKDIAENTFSEWDEPIPEEQVAIVKREVAALCRKYNP